MVSGIWNLQCRGKGIVSKIYKYSSIYIRDIACITFLFQRMNLIPGLAMVKQ